MPVKVLPQ